MFNGAYFDSILRQHSTTGGFCHVVGYCIDSWLSFYVNALDFISMIVRSRIKCYSEIKSSVKTFPAQ